MTPALPSEISAVAQRWPKTDRLILSRLLSAAAEDAKLRPDVTDGTDRVGDAHAILVRWADMETKGRLANLSETQLQGDFLSEVFGEALGYTRAVEGAEWWQLEQHHTIGTQIPDAVLGEFRQELEDAEGNAQPAMANPLAVVELKGPKVDLDRDRSNGRTAVDQCWDYLVNTPATCRWGIVSNFVSFRLYERDSTKRCYEHFSLQQLREPAEFRKFYTLFHCKGLIQGASQLPPWAVTLLRKTIERQRTVGDELYEAYSQHRIRLIQQLHLEEERSLDAAVEMAQRLFDRILFIAFCEDRELLPTGTISRAYEIAGFSAVTNPRWQNFKNLFRFVDKGESRYGIQAYNGGLFAEHEVDELELPDEPYAKFFDTVGGYDFADEVNLDVLGHLFERSITELEKIKESGLFGGDAKKATEFAEMPQSAKRKRLGVYYTPPELTSRIVEHTIDELILERYADLAEAYGIERADALQSILPDDKAFWRSALEMLRNLRVVDPACGSGAFLFQAYDTLEARYYEAIRHLGDDQSAEVKELSEQVPTFLLGENLYGVDLSPEAVEITQLALWIRSATPGQTLTKLADHIVHGNSLVHDPEVSPHGFDWQERFPEVFDRPGYQKPGEEASGGGFDCVVGNPPWERADLSEREFFSLPAPEIATATTGAKRKKMVAALEKSEPTLYERYIEVKASIDAQRAYFRKSGEFPLTGKGRTNFYAVFAELASQLVAPQGRVGLLVPSGIASDKTTKDFFASVAETDRLIRLYDFENRTKKFFPDVDGRFKFCILNFGGTEVKVDAAQFVFFAHSVEELDDPARQIALTGDDIKLLNPNTRTCPIFRTRRDAELTKAIYRRVPILIDKNRKGPTGNPWGVDFQRMFDQTNDAELFREADELQAEGLTLEGNRWVGKEKTYLPVYEAKMLQAYDHRAADVVTTGSNWVRQGQTSDRTLVDYQNPEYLAMPRYWVEPKHVESELEENVPSFLCFKDVTSPTNRRTMIASFTSLVGVVNSAPIVFTTESLPAKCCLLSNLNSFVYDYVARQKISNVHLNFFIVEQVPTIPPVEYAKPCPWDSSQTLESWISERVLKLSCTAEDMLPLAEACEFTSGSFEKEYGGRLNRWDEAERVQLMAEIDAAYFHLYGLSRDDAAYVLSTFKGIDGPSDLVPDGRSIAENVLRVYDELNE